MINLNKKGAIKLLGLFAAKPEVIEVYRKRIESLSDGQVTPPPSFDELLMRLSWSKESVVHGKDNLHCERRMLLALVMKENLGLTAITISKQLNMNRSHVYHCIKTATANLESETYYLRVRNQRNYQAILNALQ